jgi:processive rubber oxygenase RoxA-like protein
MATPDEAASPPPRRVDNTALKWFRGLVWAGIVANMILALVSITIPAKVLQFLRLDPATPLLWPRFACFLLILLSVFYVPAARDPVKNSFSAVWTVACRFGGVAFFAIVGGRYIVFGLFDLVFGLPQAVALYLGWRGRDDSVAGRRLRTALVSLAALVVIGSVGWVGYQQIMRPKVPVFASDEEHFKYGSIGNDGAAGIPYRMWTVLPQVCARLVPGQGGYAAFGFRWDPGRDPAVDPPIGFSKAKVGVERMSINCAICHITSVRLSADAQPQLYPGGASNTVDVQGYQRFLSRCAQEDEFSPKFLIPAMEAKGKLSWLDRLTYKYVLIPVVRKRLVQQGEAFAWTDQRPTWGPGRIDPFNPVKFGMLGMIDDGTIGNSDMQAVWNLDARERIRPNAPFHWDGLNTSLREVIISSALGDGAVAEEFSFDSMARIERFLRKTAPPPSPHRPDGAAVERGKAVFAAQCADCHSPDGKRTLTIIPAHEVGTDTHRLRMWTVAARDTYGAYRKGYNWEFRSFQKTDGYIAEPLNGLWLSGPYLHNGSVPTLRDLLAPPAQRPVTFVRGPDVVDGTNGGFVSPSCDPRAPPKEGFCYDTRLAGNGNGGHVFGTTLSPTEKADLLAYLLTL